ncbi:MAG: HAD family hydrolase [Gemmatimonadota bacterium]|nr:HAD family hydrolase [Gemmatimonadota bacterium]
MSVLALFDIDGTLVDTAGAGSAAVEVALVEVFGTPGPIDELSFAGLTDPLIVRTLMRHAGFEDHEIDARAPALWAAYTAHLVDRLAEPERRARSRVHEGVPELLDALEVAEAALGLVTGNIAEGARLKLDALGIADRFGFGSYGSDAEDRDLLPAIAIERARAATGTSHDPTRTWIIGDTPRDIACARATGIRVLAVATGSFSVDELVAAGADHAVESLAETDEVLRLLDV